MTDPLRRGGVPDPIESIFSRLEKDLQGQAEGPADDIFSRLDEAVLKRQRTEENRASIRSAAQPPDLPPVPDSSHLREQGVDPVQAAFFNLDNAANQVNEKDRASDRPAAQADQDFEYMDILRDPLGLPNSSGEVRTVRIRREDIGLKEFNRAVGAEAIGGPVIGWIEAMGIAPKGTRKRMQENYLAIKHEFETTIDPDTGEEVRSTGKKISSNAMLVAASIIPLMPSAKIGAFFGKLFGASAGRESLRAVPRLIDRARSTAASGLAGALEASVIGFGEAQALGKERRPGAVGLFAGLGATLSIAGNVAGRVLSKAAAKRAAAKTGGLEVGGELEFRDTTGEDFKEWVDKQYKRAIDDVIDRTEPTERVGRKMRQLGMPELAESIELTNSQFTLAARTVDNGITKPSEMWSNVEEGFVHTLIPKKQPDGTIAMQRVKTAHGIFSNPQRTTAEFREDLDYHMAYRRLLANAGLHRAAREAGDKKALAYNFKIDESVVARAEKYEIDLAAKYADSLDANGLNRMDRAAEDVRDVTHGQVVQMVKGGLISKNAGDRMLARGPDYVPFAHLAHELEATASGRSVNQSLVKALRNGGLDPDNPIGSPVTQAFANQTQINIQVRKQLVKSSLVDAFEASPDDFPLMKRRGTTTKELPKLPSEELKKLSSENPGNEAVEMFRRGDLDTEGGMAVNRPDPKRPGEMVREIWDVPEDLMKATASMTPQQMNAALRLSASFTRTLRAGALSTGSFGVRQLIRDPQNAFVISQNNFVPFVSTMDVAFDLAGGVAGSGAARKQVVQGYADEFRRSGVFGATLTGLDQKLIRDRVSLERALNEGAKRPMRRQLDRWAHNPLYPFQVLNDMGEVSTRFPEFVKARDAGKGVLRSAKEAGQVALPFHRAGTVTRTVNDNVPFFNASVKDTEQVIKALTDPKRARTAWIKGFASVTVPSLGLYLKNRNDPEYQNASEWQKNVFYFIYKRDDGSFVKVPRPIGLLNVLFGLLPETALRFVEAKDNENPLEGAKALDQLENGFLDQTFPGLFASPVLDQGKTLALGVTPQVFKPLAEAVFDQQLFYDRNVMPTRLKGMLKEYQVKPATSEVAKRVSGFAVGAFGERDFVPSPILVQHMIDGYLGTAGKEASQAADIGLLGESVRSEDPGRGLKDVPVLGGLIRSFVSSPYGFDTQPVTDLYDLRERARDASKVIRNDPENLDVYLDTVSAKPEFLLLSELNTMTKQISDMREEREFWLAVEPKNEDEAQKRELEILQIDQMATTMAASWLPALMKEMVEGKDFNDRWAQSLIPLETP